VTNTTLLQAFGNMSTYEASTSPSAPNNLQSYATATYATLDYMRAQIHAQGADQQRLEAELQNQANAITTNTQ